jgi:Endosomal/lysosomal potassium channel TMEM175
VRRKSRPDRTNNFAPAGSLGKGVGRLEAFSDGVLAIVITLLILDFRVPARATGHLGRELAGMWRHYTAYLLSFLVIGILWLITVFLTEVLTCPSPALSPGQNVRRTTPRRSSSGSTSAAAGSR